MINTLGTELKATGAATAQLQERGTRLWYNVRVRAVLGIVYIAREDWETLKARVAKDTAVTPVARGFYLGGNGNTVLVPAWTLDDEAVARYRRIARWPRWLRRLFTRDRRKP